MSASNPALMMATIISVLTPLLLPQDSHVCASCAASQRHWSTSAGCLKPPAGSTSPASSCHSNWPGPSPFTRARWEQPATQYDKRPVMTSLPLRGKHCSALPWNTRVLCGLQLHQWLNLMNCCFTKIGLKRFHSVFSHSGLDSWNTFQFEGNTCASLKAHLASNLLIFFTTGLGSDVIKVVCLNLPVTSWMDESPGWAYFWQNTPSFFNNFSRLMWSIHICTGASISSQTFSQLFESPSHDKVNELDAL